jgi:hypothetical protein
LRRFVFRNASGIASAVRCSVPPQSLLLNSPPSSGHLLFYLPLRGWAHINWRYIRVALFYSMTTFEEFIEKATAPGPDRLLPGAVVIAANKDGM